MFDVRCCAFPWWSVLLFGITLSGVLKGQSLPFICQGEVYLTLRPDPNFSNLNNVVIDPVTNEVIFKPIPGFPRRYYINGMGYRSVDNYIYVLEQNTHQLLRIGANGTVTELRVLTELPRLVQYPAGEVTPDGKYLVMMDGSFNTNTTMVYIDLTDPAYPVDIQGVNFRAQIFDISFDPLTSEAYGYDSGARQAVKIDIRSRTISPIGRSGQIASTMGSVFFDSFGNLYGYGAVAGALSNQNTLFKIDKFTGIVSILTRGQDAQRSDACSCPFTIKMQKTVFPREAIPCVDVFYTFTIANATGQVQRGIDLVDELPEGFFVTGIIYNPFGGTLIDGDGDPRLLLENMVIPIGVDSIVLAVNTGPTPPGIKANQARLTNLPTNLGSITVSDDPTTLTPDDSTKMVILPLAVDLSRQNKPLCPGTTFILNVEQYGAKYTWHDGSTKPYFEVTRPGIYSVLVETGCEKILDSIEVVAVPGLSVDIGPEGPVTLDLGDSIQLIPLVSSPLPYSFRWSADPGLRMSFCPDCPTNWFRPLFTEIVAVTASNEYGCTSTDELELRVNKIKDVYAPNVFSPNGDGINDYFFLYAKGVENLRRLIIFDRWGNQVGLYTNLPVNQDGVGWTGLNQQGRLMPVGVYAWMAEIEFLDEDKKIFSGDITLMR